MRGKGAGSQFIVDVHLFEFHKKRTCVAFNSLNIFLASSSFIFLYFIIIILGFLSLSFLCLFLGGFFRIFLVLPAPFCFSGAFFRIFPDFSMISAVFQRFFTILANFGRLLMITWRFLIIFRIFLVLPSPFCNSGGFFRIFLMKMAVF